MKEVEVVVTVDHTTYFEDDGTVTQHDIEQYKAHVAASFMAVMQDAFRSENVNYHIAPPKVQVFVREVSER